MAEQYDFKSITWDELKEIGTHPLGNFINGELGVMTSRGFISTKLFGALGLNGQLISFNHPNIDQAAASTDSQLLTLLLGSIKVEEPKPEEPVKKRTKPTKK